MPPFDPAISLQHLAKISGFSPMTISRVLRGLPGASPTTRKRILELAQTLGYRPDPDLAHAMGVVRAKKQKRQAPMLALIRERLPGDPIASPLFQFVSTAAIQKSALDYGYEVEEFTLGANNLSAKRLSKVLWSRGIVGVIVSPQSLTMPCHALDYSRFASAVLGYSLRAPSLHRSTTNVVPGMNQLFEELQQRGYRRVGLAVTRWIDNRTQNIFSSGLLQHRFHQALHADSSPIFYFPHEDYSQDRDAFLAWFHLYQPDVVLSFQHHVPEWLRSIGREIGRDVGYALIDWNEGAQGFAGIDHRRDHIAQGAVDLVAMQLARNERGIPEVPRHISIPPRWVDGPTLRKLP